MDLLAAVIEPYRSGISISGLRDFQTWLMCNFTSQFLRRAVRVCGYWTLQVLDRLDILLDTPSPNHLSPPYSALYQRNPLRKDNTRIIQQPTAPVFCKGLFTLSESESEWRDFEKRLFQ